MRVFQISKTVMIGSVLTSVMISHVDAAKNLETSLLKTNQSFRSNLSSQPNLDKGEVTMPVQASIIYIIEQSLPDFLSQLATQNNLRLNVSEKVSGTLKKISLPMKLELILPELSTSYGLVWHIEDKELFVSNSLENTNRLIKLGNLDMRELKNLIGNADVNPGSNKMTYLEDKNAITLIGSSKYIARIEALVRTHNNSNISN